MTKSDMFRYISIAATLKILSLSPRFYRFLGNVFGKKSRVQYGMPSYYPQRAKEFLDWCEQHNAVHNGSKVLEIGTGWVHWETIVLRLFYDVEATLFDVWDNRQLEAIKQYFAQLEEPIIDQMDLDEVQAERIRELTGVIKQANSFDELYNALGFKYIVAPSGTLRQFQDESFDLIYSYNVLEHVNKDIAQELIQDFSRVLKPGGFSIHLIDIGDHLVYSARAKTMSYKNYLRYSDKTWQRYFENKVQYFNRLQPADWLTLYQDAGLKLVAEEKRLCDIDGINIASTFQNYNTKDLECKGLVLIHVKPNGTTIDSHI